MTRKTQDPALIKLLDAREQARTAADRWWTRLKRAFNALDKAKHRVQRLSRQIDEHSRKIEEARSTSNGASAT